MNKLLFSLLSFLLSGHSFLIHAQAQSARVQGRSSNIEEKNTNAVMNLKEIGVIPEERFYMYERSAVFIGAYAFGVAAVISIAYIVYANAEDFISVQQRISDGVSVDEVPGRPVKNLVSEKLNKRNRLRPTRGRGKL